MDEDREFPREGLLQSWLRLSEALEALPEPRQALYDAVTGLPTIPLLFPRIRALLADRGEVSILCLNVVRFSRIEEIRGWKALDEVMRQVAQTLERITGAYLRDADVIAELMISGDSFVIVLSPPRDTENTDGASLEMLVERVESKVREDLEWSIPPALSSKFGCYAGASITKADPKMPLESLVLKGLLRAREQSRSREAVDLATRSRRLVDIIDGREIQTLVQPILRLEDMAVVGYEALSRGPEGSEFEHPDSLFKVAYDSDLVMRLEALCRDQAILSAAALPAGRLLFLKIEPEAVADPGLRDLMSSDLRPDAAVTPSRIVLEITERAAVRDSSAFRASVGYLRALGFSVAVDHAGAGFGSLQVVAEAKPEWLKVDMTLIRGVDTDDVRRGLVGSIATFARRAGVNLVAEGIETEEELAALREIGLEYGQGFLFAEPIAPFPDDADVYAGGKTASLKRPHDSG